MNFFICSKKTPKKEEEKNHFVDHNTFCYSFVIIYHEIPFKFIGSFACVN